MCVCVLARVANYYKYGHVSTVVTTAEGSDIIRDPTSDIKCHVICCLVK
jgi:hypothetical protein